ncbi:uncharacterized protein [Spinacia oleracea]|uniref:Uncharacterized protein n=1 Tax=Spinacia oleracea TaxID=3562 RepID=A0ABM3RIU3_SPIOL|nr:uncharacterized protein LOC130470013 [Spinacia oleracea]
MTMKMLRALVAILTENHFVIPEGKIVNDALLMRIDKPWKQHRYTLKKDYFDPVNRTREQNYAKQPDGVSDRSWTDLVDYWLLPKTQEKCEMGKNARALQGHKHDSGATSFANRREDLKKKGKFSELAFYKTVYAKEDGSFKEGTLSHQFVYGSSFKWKQAGALAIS